MSKTGVLAVALALTTSAGLAFAADGPSFAKDVQPFLARYCVECHGREAPEGGLSLDSYKGLMAGGEGGAVVVVDKPNDSRLVGMIEGKTRPAMPPTKARQPKPEEIAVVRAWVLAGAKEGEAARVSLPAIKPSAAVPPPVAALAYRPDGKLLAAGGHGEIHLLDPVKGTLLGKISGQSGPVSALAFSRDGKTLGAASGSSGTAGEVKLYAVPSALPFGQPTHTVAAHQDAILGMDFSPDGKTLATCGYDRLVKLWDVATGNPVRELRDHSDSVYSVAFSPDGKLLASAAADRAVKVWDAATGKRLYTLGDPTDWVYAVAWNPAGKTLAAAGVDKSIRVWEAGPTGGKLLFSVFAHEGSVTRVVYSGDGRTLYSVGDDRTPKAWDVAKMVERTAYPRQAETPLSFAVRPDHKQIAVGRYDGGLALLDEATGKTQAEPLPIKPRPPTVSKVTPAAGTRGRTVRVVVEGMDLAGATVTASVAAVKLESKLRDDGKRADLTLTLPADAPPGPCQLTFATSAGQVKAAFTIDRFDAVPEAEPNDSPRTGQRVVLPATLVGGANKAGDVDYFRFDAVRGQQLGVEAVTSAFGSKLEPILTLIDPDGNVVAESTSGLLACTCQRAGTYALGVRDRDYRGDGTMTYRLAVGEVPVVSAVFPPGLKQGTEAEVRVEGVHLGDARTVKVKVPADAMLGSRVPVPVLTPHGPALGNPSVVVGEFPEVTAAKDGETIPVPGTGNGRLAEAGATGTWKFAAKKGERLILEMNARRLGSPMDPALEVLDAKGQPIPVAVLRGTAKTFVTFRDHDSASPGIRIDSWTDLGINDYLFVGRELVRIRALPKGPDDDCQFVTAGGQRVGHLGTTPTFHAQGEPMYKVTVHPPGTTFPPNGLPVVTLYAENDDGGAGFGKDSRLTFDPPADGDYQVRVRDTRGEGGPAHVYRLTLRRPRPSFKVTFTPTTPSVSKGSGLPIAVNAERFDGYDGAIDLKLENLPPGFSAPVTNIPAGENSTSFTLFAEPTAAVPADAPPLRLVAKATIDGKELVREVAGGLPKVIEPGSIVTTTDQSEVAVKPGGEVRLTVRIERRNNFAGRIPIDVRGLPPGVRVLDIGLNGILITEKETARTVVIYAEPWVEPTTHPIVVLARLEGKNTEHAAKSVLLKVAR